MRVLSSVEALRERSESWNALWGRAGNAPPTARAELVAQWLDHFAGSGESRAIVVEAPPQDSAPTSPGRRLLAAMPLVAKRLPLGLRCAVNPFNFWAAAGELLLDESGGQGAVDQLVDGVRGLGWPLLMLRGVPLTSPAYRMFEEACRRRGMATYGHTTHEVGLVELGSDFEAYMSTRSKNHRAHMRKARRRAEREGGVSLRIVRGGSETELADFVRAGFAVERSGWKGRAGTSVLDVEGLARFFEVQAGLLAGAGALQLVFLEHHGRPIAFEYGFANEGTYYTPKVGYDEKFSNLSPSQLLRAKKFESMCGESPQQWVDFAGPLAEATAKWCTSTYPVGNLLVALERPLGDTLVWGYRAYQRYKEFRRRAAPGGHEGSSRSAPQRSERTRS